jgi:cytochrome P450
VIETVDHWVEKSLSAKAPISASAGTQRYHFLQELASQTTDKKRIRAEAISVLFAARDSTAALLTNVWFELSKRPDIWARLSQEIATLNGSKPTYEELKNLKYLRAVLNESQRLYPVAPINGLVAREDTANRVLSHLCDASAEGSVWGGRRYLPTGKVARYAG